MIWHPEALVAIRGVRGLSGRELASQAVIAPSYLRRLEHSGPAAPSPEVVHSLGLALAVAPEALYVDAPIEQLTAELVAKIDGTRDRLDVAIDILQRLRKAS